MKRVVNIRIFSLEGYPVQYYGLFILEDAVDLIIDQLSKVQQPFMGYYHLLPPHEPYNPRAEFLNIFNDGWQPPSQAG